MCEKILGVDFKIVISRQHLTIYFQINFAIPCPNSDYLYSIVLQIFIICDLDHTNLNKVLFLILLYLYRQLRGQHIL